MNIDTRLASIGALIVIGAVMVFAHPSLLHVGSTPAGDSTGTHPTQTQTQPQQTSGQQTQQNTHNVKLSDTRYAPYSFLISGDSLSPRAKQAIAGFTVSKNTSNGVTTITLNAKRPQYHDQTYTLKNGEKLYFIETSMGDDPSGQEFALGDDTGVVVDANGYIVQS